MLLVLRGIPFVISHILLTLRGGGGRRLVYHGRSTPGNFPPGGRKVKNLLQAVSGQLRDSQIANSGAKLLSTLTQKSMI